jgi:hypothetical protein
VKEIFEEEKKLMKFNYVVINKPAVIYKRIEHNR